MMNDAMFAIIMSEVREKVASANDLEGKLQAAMRGAKNHWMVLDEQTQFKAAVGAVMIDYGEDSADFQRLEAEMKALRTLAAMASGIPVDISRLDTSEEPIGLTKMWKEIQ